MNHDPDGYYSIRPKTISEWLHPAFDLPDDADLLMVNPTHCPTCGHRIIQTIKPGMEHPIARDHPHVRDVMARKELRTHACPKVDRPTS